MDSLIDYGLRILPAATLIVLVYVLLPRKNIVARIFLLIIGFILVRDAMTPLGLWAFGHTDSAIWVRFLDDHFVLIVLGIVSIALTAVILRSQHDLLRLIRWGNPRSILTYGLGIGGALLISLPFILQYPTIPVDDRGGVVAGVVVPAVLFFALAGNFLEEVLFRGMWQGYLVKETGTVRAIIISGLTFAAGHAFLATTVTDIGWPLLAFVLYEGLICATIAHRSGILASTIAHGGAIFLLSTSIL